MSFHISRSLPEKLKPLADLAFDLRWTGSQTASRIWHRLDPDMWERTRNPVALLMNVHDDRLQEAACDAELLGGLQLWLERVARHDSEPAWFELRHGREAMGPVAYFSMEFGLSEALPIYSGGLGMLAGDHLKSASSQGLPLTGIGLLYQQGYFRQFITEDGTQEVLHPYNEPSSLPVRPVYGEDGHWLRVRLPLPGRILMVRLWEARVGRVRLLLLDSNDPMNSPQDRAITAQLYNADRKTRLLQELVLGVGGWQALEKLSIEPDVCHLNEGHAAFAVVARAAAFAKRESVPFATALWATRAGNVFTTHTPVSAAFDRFDASLIAQYTAPLAHEADIAMDELLRFGQEPDSGLFNMAFLAMRGCGHVNGVSRLHGEVSRMLFASLFPGRPFAEVPVSHITNGVHVPTWDSSAANTFWRRAWPESWSRNLDAAAVALETQPDEEVWAFRNAARTALVEFVRERLARRYRERHATEDSAPGNAVLDPKALIIGFARRFTSYKRPGLLFYDANRLARLLGNSDRPVQLLIAGKAHPNDYAGADMVREVVRFCQRDDVSSSAVFLEDYDMTVAEYLTGGVDVWLNNPARPMEACGTSGMKTLVNGGLNLSTLDGWWDEAFDPEVGWAFGGRENDDIANVAADAESLYRILEEEVIPEFYQRDEHGLPRRWIQRVRASMTRLTPRFSSDGMVREYVEKAYLPAMRQHRSRTAMGASLAKSLEVWNTTILHAWKDVQFGSLEAQHSEDCWRFEVQVRLGTLMPGDVAVELYAEDPATGQPSMIPMQIAHPPSHPTEFGVYVAEAPADRPQEHFTPRVQALHPDIVNPLEAPFILWQS